MSKVVRVLCEGVSRSLGSRGLVSVVVTIAMRFHVASLCRSIFRLVLLFEPLCSTKGDIRRMSELDRVLFVESLCLAASQGRNSIGVTIVMHASKVRRVVAICRAGMRGRRHDDQLSTGVDI